MKASYQIIGMPDQRGLTEHPPVASAMASGSTAPGKEERGDAGLASRESMPATHGGKYR